MGSTPPPVNDSEAGTLPNLRIGLALGISYVTALAAILYTLLGGA